MTRFSRSIATLVAAIGTIFSTTAKAEFTYTTPGHGKPLVIVVPGIWGDKMSFTAPGHNKSWLQLMKDDHVALNGERKLSDYATAMLTFPSGCSDRLSIPQIAARLATELRDQGVWTNHPSVIFLTHSLGGLVVQDMLAMPREKIGTVSLSDRTAGVIFLATPVAGSDDATTLASVLEALPGSIPNCQLLQDLKSIDGNAFLQKLDEQWRSFVSAQTQRLGADGRLRLFCLYETKPIFGRVIVPLRYSAGVCDGDRLAVAADHQSIAKPATTDADVYRMVKGRLAAIDQANKLRNPPTPLHAPRSGVIDRQPNTYVEGKGYQTLPNTDWGTCAKACADDRRCKMIEHFRPKNECNLYAHDRVSGKAPQADVGIKRGSGADAGPQVVGYPKNTMIRRPGTFIPGTGYSLVKRASPEQCLDLCGADARCRASEFYAPTGNCNLFDSKTVLPTQSKDSHVGVKADALQP